MTSVEQWSYETRPRAEFRRRRSARSDHRRRALLRSPAPRAGTQIPDADVLARPRTDLRRRRVRHLAERPHLVGDPSGLRAAALDGGADRQRPPPAAGRGTAALRL